MSEERKRGRPPKYGVAMSGADRQREYVRKQENIAEAMLLFAASAFEYMPVAVREVWSKSSNPAMQETVRLVEERHQEIMARRK